MNSDNCIVIDDNFKKRAGNLGITSRELESRIINLRNKLQKDDITDQDIIDSLNPVINVNAENQDIIDAYNKWMEQLTGDGVIYITLLSDSSILQLKQNATSIFGENSFTIYETIDSNGDTQKAFKLARLRKISDLDIKIEQLIDANTNSHPNLVYNKGQREAIVEAVKYILGDKSIDYNTLTIQGKAGTGKTTIVGEIINIANLIRRERNRYSSISVAVSALSHQAKSNLEQKIAVLLPWENKKGLVSKTLAGLFGIKPDRNGLFDYLQYVEPTKKGATLDAPINKVDVVFIDEASMVTEEVLDALNLAVEHNDHRLKVIFLGDKGQLCPIRERRNTYYRQNHSDNFDLMANSFSPVFSQMQSLDGNNKGKIINLTQIVRQGDGSPILNIASLLHELSSTERPITKNEIIDVLNNNKEDKLDSNSGAIIHVRKGINAFASRERLFPLYMEAVRKSLSSENGNMPNPYHCKIVTYTTNDADKAATKQWNTEIRRVLVEDKLIENGEERISKGDSIIVMNNITAQDRLLGNKKDEIPNSSQYLVVKAEKKESEIAKGFPIIYYDCEISNGKSIFKNIPIILKGDEKNDEYSQYKDAINQLKERINLYGWDSPQGRLAHFDLQKITNTFTLVDYGFAIGAHKSQGSTYDIAVVDVSDAIEKDRDPKNCAQCLYTAITRAANEVILLGNVDNNYGLDDSQVNDFEEINENIQNSRRGKVLTLTFPSVQQSIKEIKQNDLRQQTSSQNLPQTTTDNTNVLPKQEPIPEEIRTKISAVNSLLSVRSKDLIREINKEFNVIAVKQIGHESPEDALLGELANYFDPTNLLDGTIPIIAFRIKGNGNIWRDPDYARSNRVIGNPFSQGAGQDNNKGIDTVAKFLSWIITGNNYNQWDATPELRLAFIDIIKESNEQRCDILYYKNNMSYASHATAIGFLVKNKELLEILNLPEIAKLVILLYDTTVRDYLLLKDYEDDNDANDYMRKAIGDAKKDTINTDDLGFFFSKEEIEKIKSVQGSGNLKIKSASRLTDPAFFSETIINLLKENAQKSLDDPTRINAIQIWTKHDGVPLENVLLACEKYRVAPILSFSISSLGDTAFEKGVLNYNDLINLILKLIENGYIKDTSNMTIRIDPIIPGVTQYKDIKDIIKRCSSLGVKKFVVSVVLTYDYDPKRSIVPALSEAYKKQFGKDKEYDWEKYYGKHQRGHYNFMAKQSYQEELQDELFKLLKEFDVTIQTCAMNKMNKLKTSACLDPDIILRVTGISVLNEDGTYNVDNLKRKLCNCYKHAGDMLSPYDRCRSGCVYCYMNHGADDPFVYYDDDGSLIQQPLIDVDPILYRSKILFENQIGDELIQPPYQLVLEDTDNNNGRNKIYSVLQRFGSIKREDGIKYFTEIRDCDQYIGAQIVIDGAIDKNKLNLLDNICSVRGFYPVNDYVEVLIKDKHILDRIKKITYYNENGEKRKLAIYNKEKGTVSIPTSFTVGYTIQELVNNELLGRLLNNDVITNQEIHSLARSTMFFVSDTISQIQQSEDIAEILGEDFELLPKEERDWRSKSRIQILNDLGKYSKNGENGLEYLLNYTKELIFGFTDGLSDENKDKAKFIYDNWNQFVILGNRAIMDLENISISNDRRLTILELDLTTKEENKNDDGVNQKDEQLVLELFGSSQESWQINFRSVEVFSSLSLLVKREIMHLNNTDKEGNKKINEWGLYENIDPGYAVLRILYITLGARNSSDMIQMLKDNVDKYPWLVQFVGNDSKGIKGILNNGNQKFLNQFFSNMKKYFQKYAVVVKDKDGVFITRMMNGERDISDMKKAFFGKISLGKSKLRDENGWVEGEVKNLKEVALRLSSSKLNNENLIDSLTIRDILYLYSIFSQESPSVEDVKSRVTSLNEINNLGSSVSYIADAILSNIKNSDFDLNKNLSNNLKNLFNFLATVFDNNLSVATRANGKVYYSYVLPSYLNMLVQQMKGINLSDEEDYLDFIYNQFLRSSFISKDDGSIIYSDMIEQLYNNNDARRIFDHKVLLSYDKTKYTDLRGPAYAASLMCEFFYDPSKKTSWYRVPTLSNKPSSEFIKWYRINDENNEKFEDIIAKKLVNLFILESRRIAAVQQRRENENVYKIKNFDKNGDKYLFLDFIEEQRKSDPEFGKKVDEYIESLKSGEEVTLDVVDLQNRIKRGLDRLFEEHLAFWKGIGLIDGNYSSKFVDLGSNRDERYRNLKNYLYNDFFATSQIFQVFIGDKAFYDNDEDLQKRLAELHAPGIRGNTDARDWNNVDQLVSDGKRRYVVLKDSKIKDESVKLLTNFRDNVILKRPASERRDQMVAYINKAIDAYMKINETDAQTYLCPTSLRKTAIMYGEWSDQQEEAYKIIKDAIDNNKPIDQQKLLKIFEDIAAHDGITSWQPKKPFLYTQILKHTGSSVMPTMNMGVQVKTAEYTLLTAAAMLGVSDLNNSPSRLLLILKFMEDSANKNSTRGIDAITFESSIKAGLTGEIDLSGVPVSETYNKLLGTVYNDDLQKYDDRIVLELPFMDYGIQQNLPAHNIDHEQQDGSQGRVIAIADTPDKNANGTDNYITIDLNGKETRMTVALAKKLYLKIEKENIDMSLDDIMEDLMSDSGSLKIKNIALSRVLQDLMANDTMFDPELMYGVMTTNGEFNLPLSEISISGKIQLLLTSYIKNRICKQKIAGGPIVQVSSFGVKEPLELRWYKKDDKSYVLLTEREFNEVKQNTRSIADFERLIGSKVAEISGANQTYELYLAENLGDRAYYESYNPIPSKQFYEDFKDENGFIDIEKVRKYAPDALYSIITRIPTEQKYSMIPSRTKDFVSHVNGEIVMLPSVITMVTGSDFDGDKGYQERYELIRIVEEENGQKVVRYIRPEAPKEVKTRRDRALLKKVNNNMILDIRKAFLNYKANLDLSMTPGNFDEPKRLGYIYQALNTILANEENKNVIRLHEGFWTRKDVYNNPDVLYIFTDNTDRNSGDNVISSDNWYSDKYGEGHHFPNQTTAVARGLNNARPISTMHYYYKDHGFNHPKYDRSSNALWHDSDVEEFTRVIKSELEDIVKEFKTGKYERIEFPDGDGLFNSELSNITKARTPVLYQRLGELLHLYGLDYMVPSDIKIPDDNVPQLRGRKLSALEIWNDLNELYNGNKERSKQICEKYNVEYDEDASPIDIIKNIGYQKHNLMYPKSQVLFHRQNMAAGQLISIFAVQNVSHAIMTFNDIVKFMDIHDPDGNELGFVVKIDQANGSQKVVKIGGRTPIDQRFNYNGKRVGDELGLLLAAAVDAVKDPVLNLANINEDTVSYLVSLMRLGFSMLTATLILNLPVVKRVYHKYLLEKAVNDKARLSKFINDAIRELSEQNGSINSASGISELMLIDNLSSDKILNNLYILEILDSMETIVSTFNSIVNLTKMNSIASGYGPRISNVLLSMFKLQDFNENRYLAKEEETKLTITNDMISSFIDDLNVASNEIFSKRFLQYSRFVQDVLMTYYKMYNTHVSELTIDDLVDFISNYMILSEIDGKAENGGVGPVQSLIPLDGNQTEYRRKMIFDLPGKVDGLKLKYNDNYFIRLLNVSIENNIPVINIETSNLDDESIIKAKEGWADFHKIDPKASLGLVSYWFLRGGLGFSPKTPLKQLMPLSVKLDIPKYIDKLRSLERSRNEINASDLLKEIDRIILLFELHNNEFKKQIDFKYIADDKVQKIADLLIGESIIVKDGTLVTRKVKKDGKDEMLIKTENSMRNLAPGDYAYIHFIKDGKIYYYRINRLYEDQTVNNTPYDSSHIQIMKVNRLGGVNHSALELDPTVDCPTTIFNEANISAVSGSQQLGEAGNGEFNNWDVEHKQMYQFRSLMKAAIGENIQEFKNSIEKSMENQDKDNERFVIQGFLQSKGFNPDIDSLIKFGQYLPNLLKTIENTVSTVEEINLCFGI